MEKNGREINRTGASCTVDRKLAVPVAMGRGGGDVRGMNLWRLRRRPGPAALVLLLPSLLQILFVLVAVRTTTHLQRLWPDTLHRKQKHGT